MSSSSSSAWHHATYHTHLDRMVWAYRDGFSGIWLNLLSRLQFEGDMLRQNSEEQMALHHGKMVADADARSRTEGHIGIAWQMFFVDLGKTFGLELRGIGEVVGPTMNGIDGQNDQFSTVYGITIKLQIV